MIDVMVALVLAFVVGGLVYHLARWIEGPNADVELAD